MRVSSLICGDACLQHGKKQIRLEELITFGLAFLIKVNFFDTLKSGNEKVDVLMVTLAQLLYTNTFLNFFF